MHTERDLSEGEVIAAQRLTCLRELIEERFAGRDWMPSSQRLPRGAAGEGATAHGYVYDGTGAVRRPIMFRSEVGERRVDFAATRQGSRTFVTFGIVEGNAKGQLGPYPIDTAPERALLVNVLEGELMTGLCPSTAAESA